MKGKGVHREPVQGGLYACKHIQGKERRKEERKEGKGRKKEKEERKRRRKKEKGEGERRRKHIEQTQCPTTLIAKLHFQHSHAKKSARATLRNSKKN